MEDRLLARPKRMKDENEDDLMEFQENFRRSTMEPAAKVIRVEKQNEEQKSVNHQTSVNKNDAVFDLSKTTVIRPVIKERDVTAVRITEPKLVNDAFPAVHHRGNLDNITVTQVKKSSLFAKQMQRDGKLKVAQDLNKITSVQRTSQIQQQQPSMILSGAGLGEVTGKRELQRIHEENVERLQSMSEAEILDEKEKLLNTLDPKLVAFIRKKNKQQAANNVQEAMKMDIDETEQKNSFDSQNLLPVETDTKWLHMDKVEHDKLEWMKEIQAPSVNHGENNINGVPARFDFKGNLISRSEVIPVTASLHHHGDEPEAAGYTLEELFHLARSTILQQRVIALQTLSNIITQAHSGIYDAELHTSLLPILIEAGLLFVIRWAMDEQVDIIYMTAIECMANLIAPKYDEVKLIQLNYCRCIFKGMFLFQDGLDKTIYWPCGYLQPALTPNIDFGEKRVESDLTDIELLQQDIIKCLLRMNIFRRLLYLLDRMKQLSSSSNVVTPVKRSFDILIRIARHSMHSANEILNDKQLMDFIFREFIPETFTMDVQTSLYGYPLKEALKLCRVISLSGAPMASTLISQYNIHTLLHTYIATNLNCVHNKLEMDIMIELLALWRIYLLYGLLSEDSISLLSMVFLPSCQTFIQQLPHTITSTLLLHIISLFDALMFNSMKSCLINNAANQSRRNPSEQSTTIVYIQSVNWSYVDGLFDLILSTGKQILALITTDKTLDPDELTVLDNLLLVCMSCLASFIIGQQTLAINLIDLRSKAQLVQTHIIEPVLHLFRTKLLDSKLMSIKNGIFTQPSNSMMNLPTLIQTELSSSIPFGYLTAVLRLINAVYTIDKQAISKYLVKLSSASAKFVSWFERFEHIFIFYLMQTLSQEHELSSTYYEVLFLMMSHLLHGHYYLAQEILKLILADKAYWKKRDTVEINDNLHDLKLDEQSSRTICLASNEIIINSSAKDSVLYEDSIDYLQSLYYHYLNILKVNRQTDNDNLLLSTIDVHYALLSEVKPKLIARYMYSSNSNMFIDHNWFYGLLPSYYARAIDVVEEEQKLGTVLSTLRFVYMLEMKKCSLLKLVNMTTRYSMIAGIYLLGSNIFLNKDVVQYMTAFLNLYNDNGLLQKLDTKTTVQSLMTFFDFFRLLVDQFEASSFGDVLFSCYLFIPLQQGYDVQLRKIVWIEHATTLKFLRLKPNELLIPLQTYFYPAETDIELISCYAQVLIREHIKKDVQPLLHMIAVHHLNIFIFDQTSEHKQLKSSILKWIRDKNDQSLYDDIINYKTFSTTGIISYTVLPQLRTNWLNGLTI
ncbi:unnamed protein product [Didymodactylos carnosus]|uniref:RNA polymerase II-associated protein 1 n=1 Tax=Didymodactylos carnosus TaxID=1234261 RepID=A0A814BH59_9BILA|nr:unnamed protein product [Didymodactylos carnosus]CAF0940261.1 unnamed protein product [Didymodactylos carnosus]CAF3705919.1 unnamed protein product [Didymodactylos carnosus]CAF3715470.1 unnamed protein product [Didymodactylos carnosus]